MPTLAKPQMWWPGINRQHPLARGLVGYWPFWEGAGGRAGDLINGNHGTLTNMDPATDWVGSPYGWALDFDGGDDYLDTPKNLYDFGVRTALTFYALVYPRATADMLCEDGTGYATDGIYMYFQSATVLRLNLQTTAGQWNEDAAIPNYHNRWVHAAFVWSNGRPALWTDGIERFSGSHGGTIDQGNAPLDIGQRPGGSLQANMRLAFAGLWKRGLGPAEIQQLYADPFAMLRPRRHLFVSIAEPPEASLMPLFLAHYRRRRIA